MKLQNLFALLVLVNLLLVETVGVKSQELEAVFDQPPEEALPRGYWLWPQGNFDYSVIAAELREFKEIGIGGVDIFDLGVADRNDVIPEGPGFMSERQIDGIVFALEEAKKLGLKIGLIASSSWNAGASWTKPEEAGMNLLAWQETVSGPTNYQKQLPFPEVPEEFSKPYGSYPLHVPKREDGLPLFYQDVAVVAFPVSDDGVADEENIILLTDQFDEDGLLNFDVPEGEWTIMRLVCTNFGQRLWLPSDHSQGLIMDHFSKAATQKHFQTIIDRLETRLGPLEDSALERLYLCSYESVADVNWTPEFSREFAARNGYAIEPYLPALFGTVIEDEDHTERFLYDYHKTLSDVFVENLYLEASSICRAHGLLLCSESGGPGPPLHNVPTEDLKALGAVDVMRGEFWNRGTPWKDEDGFNLLQVVKGIASAAHTYGHKVVEMEAFTSHIHWQEGPSTFKPLADQAFCEGMTRVVYHTMAHNLPEAGKPGWTYQAGTHMSTNLTWWPLSKPLHEYHARCSALLQSGHFVADAVYYYGHDIPNFAKPKHIRPDLGPGYDYDDLNTEILMKADVADGKVVLESGMEYEVLVLPNSERMDLAALKKIDELLQNGATVVGPRPRKIYGLKGYPEDEHALNQLADQIWGTDDNTIDQAYGRGRIVNGKSTREVLLEKGVTPDVQVIGAAFEAVDWIHRKTENEDIYFVRNVTDEPLSIDAIFRITDKVPVFWDAVTGERKSAAIYAVEDNGVRVPIEFDGHGSIFVVFQKAEGNLPYITQVTHDEQTIFPLEAGQTCNASIGLEAFYIDAGIVCNAKTDGGFEVRLSDGASKNVMLGSSTVVPVEGGWQLGFPHGWGTPTSVVFEQLQSWTDSEHEGVRHFSGIATYRKTIELDLNTFQNYEKIILDLGDLYEIARVYLNGKALGISTFAPHRFDVTDVVRTGENHLVVEIANTWLNRLIADDQLPMAERLTHSNLSTGPNNRSPWRDAEPLVSGLLGPVRFVGEAVDVIEPD